MLCHVQKLSKIKITRRRCVEIFMQDSHKMHFISFLKTMIYQPVGMDYEFSNSSTAFFTLERIPVFLSIRDLKHKQILGLKLICWWIFR